MDANSSARRVVAGVDGSASSFEALRWAVRYAALTGGTVEAVTAWEQPSGWFAPPMEAAFDLESAREVQARELREALGDEDAAGVRAVLVHGNPGDVLLQSAEGAAVLVVGSRGHGGFARAMLGSVSQRVALHADCPVVIVRAGKP
ncbi:universal stress protein [Streptomyces sp. NPDC047000]|uniref:universal stress protein n=1 Tax=Streptomyces sp. NPDC047000 TaxID=3155474 RepID=UPI0033C033F7